MAWLQRCVPKPCMFSTVVPGGSERTTEIVQVVDWMAPAAVVPDP